MPKPAQHYEVREGSLLLQRGISHTERQHSSPSKPAPNPSHESLEPSEASGSEQSSTDGDANAEATPRGAVATDTGANAVGHELAAPIQTALERNVALIKKRAAATRLGPGGGGPDGAVGGRGHSGVKLKVRQKVLKFDTVRWLERSRGRRIVNQCILDPDELEGFREMFDQLDLDGGQCTVPMATTNANTLPLPPPGPT